MVKPTSTHLRRRFIICVRTDTSLIEIKRVNQIFGIKLFCILSNIKTQ